MIKYDSDVQNIIVVLSNEQGRPDEVYTPTELQQRIANHVYYTIITIGWNGYLEDEDKQPHVCLSMTTSYLFKGSFATYIE